MLCRYKNGVQRLIDGRGRENYQQATGYLARVRRLYHKQGREPEWQAYMTNLRNSNKSLRALEEELDKRELKQRAGTFAFYQRETREEWPIRKRKTPHTLGS